MGTFNKRKGNQLFSYTHLSKALETIYHMASSLIGKLISGKQYLGSYTLDQVRDKVEAEGKELPFNKKKKLPQHVTALASTSRIVMEH